MRSTAIGLLVAVSGCAVACGGSSSSAPTAPAPTTTNSAPSVSSVTVNGPAVMVGGTAQFTATATLSNGTTQTVTTEASWQSSSAAIATVTNAGMVTGVAPGEVDISAIYQSMLGRTRVSVIRPTPTTYTVTGAITDGTSGGVLPNINVQLTDASGANKSATTNSTGNYTIAGVGSGTTTITASAVSYQTSTKSVNVTSDVRVDFVLARTPPAQGKVSFSTTANKGWTSIDVSVNGQFLGTLRRFFEPNSSPSSCDAVQDARLVWTGQPNTVTYSARTDRGGTWNGTATVSANGCQEILLTCPNRDCSASPAPSPTPTPAPTPPPPSPTPTPTPPPPLTLGLYVWGGTNHTQYLGFFTCTFCKEFAADSINNEFGSYGSPFSSTSIRNEFSQYGSPFSTNSACNQFATNPPRVYNSNRSVYYGELTLNQFRLDAIKSASIVSWLQNDVCRH